MRRFLRKRFLVLFLGVLVVLGVSLYTDPNKGMATLLSGIDISQAIWAIAAAHIIRKILTDYPEADQQGLFKVAKESSIGAGLALIALALIFLGLLLIFAPRAHATDYVPPGFVKYGQTLKAEQAKYWPEHPAPFYLAALVEQESCISLKSKSCWNPTARLKTSREEGAGVGQITRAYRSDGSLRFDALADLRDNYSEELGELSWGTIYTRPDLQFRALVIMSRDAARQFSMSKDWLQFGDAAYNGGIAGVKKERRACGLTEGCNPDLWFDNVEEVCLKSTKPIYGSRSACDINREHVYNVFKVRPYKYMDQV